MTPTIIQTPEGDIAVEGAPVLYVAFILSRKDPDEHGGAVGGMVVGPFYTTEAADEFLTEAVERSKGRVSKESHVIGVSQLTSYENTMALINNASTICKTLREMEDDGGQKH